MAGRRGRESHACGRPGRCAVRRHPPLRPGAVPGRGPGPPTVPRVRHRPPRRRTRSCIDGASHADPTTTSVAVSEKSSWDGLRGGLIDDRCGTRPRLPANETDSSPSRCHPCRSIGGHRDLEEHSVRAEEQPAACQPRASAPLAQAHRVPPHHLVGAPRVRDPRTRLKPRQGEWWDRAATDSTAERHPGMEDHHSGASVNAKAASSRGQRMAVRPFGSYASGPRRSGFRPRRWRSGRVRVAALVRQYRKRRSGDLESFGRLGERIYVPARANREEGRGQ